MEAETKRVRILVVCHSAHGQSRRVAERVAAVLGSAGVSTRVALAENAPPPFRFHGVVVGDSLHDRGNIATLLTWLTRHRDVLAAMPRALFQVSLASAYPKHPTWGHVFVERLRSETGFDPQVVGEFGGVLVYTRYGWRVKRTESGAGSTDWTAVDEFAHDLYDLMAAEATVVPPQFAAAAQAPRW